MDTLWYVLPGGLLIAPVLCWLWQTGRISSEASEVVMLSVVWGAGFVFHQFYRNVFELAGGFGNPRRRVNRLIWNALHPDYALPEESPSGPRCSWLKWHATVLASYIGSWFPRRRTKAAGKPDAAGPYRPECLSAVWEIWFYFHAKPEYQEHVRRQWHYVLAFSTAACASLLGLVLWIVLPLFPDGHPTRSLLIVPCSDHILGIATWLAAFLILFDKAALTERTLYVQEAYIFQKEIEPHLKPKPDEKDHFVLPHPHDCPYVAKGT